MLDLVWHSDGARYHGHSDKTGMVGYLLSPVKEMNMRHGVYWIDANSYDINYHILSFYANHIFESFIVHLYLNSVPSRNVEKRGQSFSNIRLYIDETPLDSSFI